MIWKVATEVCRLPASNEIPGSVNVLLENNHHHSKIKSIFLCHHVNRGYYIVLCGGTNIWMKTIYSISSSGENNILRISEANE